MQKGAIEDTSEKEGSLGKVEDCGDRRFGLLGSGECKPSCWLSEDDVEGEGLEERSLDLGEQSFTGDLR